MVKCQSSVTPRCLIQSDMGTDALSRLDSVKEEERDLDFVPENTIIASVLSLSSISLSFVTQF